MIRFAVFIGFSIVIFLVLLLLTWIVHQLNQNEMMIITLIVLVIISLAISGIGGYITNPFSEFVSSVANQIADQAESVYVVDKYISLTHYNRGYYTGYMLNDKPHGYGTLVYLDDNQYRYSIRIEGNDYYAIRYEGEFKDGWRDGKGTVYYEGNYREEGIYYGQWTPNKKVFDGKIWDGNERYIEAKIYSQNNTDSWIDAGDRWITAEYPQK